LSAYVLCGIECDQWRSWWWDDQPLQVNYLLSWGPTSLVWNHQGIASRYCL